MDKNTAILGEQLRLQIDILSVHQQVYDVIVDSFTQTLNSSFEVSHE